MTFYTGTSWINQGTSGTALNAYRGSTIAARTQFGIGDGTNGVTINSPTSRASGTLYISTFVRNVATDTLSLYLNNTVTSVADSTTGSTESSSPFTIGKRSGGSDHAVMELYAVLFWKRALSDSEISQIVSYYQNRIP